MFSHERGTTGDSQFKGTKGVQGDSQFKGEPCVGAMPLCPPKDTRRYLASIIRRNRPVPVLAPIEALTSDLIIFQPLHLIHDLSHRVQNLVCRRKIAVL